jgi:hypothetical protein
MRKPGSQEKQKLPQSSQRNAGMGFTTETRRIQGLRGFLSVGEVPTDKKAQPCHEAGAGKSRGTLLTIFTNIFAEA